MCSSTIQGSKDLFSPRENININVVEAENGYIISGYNFGRNYQYICSNREDLESFVNILVQDLLKKD